MLSIRTKIKTHFCEHEKITITSYTLLISSPFSAWSQEPHSSEDKPFFHTEINEPSNIEKHC